MLAPEQVERKVAAVFGEKWGRLHGEMAMLYGGIDSKEVTERATDPSGAMGAIQRILSNDVACKQRGPRLRPPAGRAAAVPRHRAGRACRAPRRRATRRSARRSSHLHERILGRYDAADSAEVERTFKLFAGIVEDAKEQKGIEKQEIYSLPAGTDAVGRAGPALHDPGLAGVVTYLLRRQRVPVRVTRRLEARRAVGNVIASRNVGGVMALRCRPCDVTS